MSSAAYPPTALPALANAHTHDHGCGHAANAPSEMPAISLDQQVKPGQASEEEYDREAAYARHLRGGCIDLSSCKPPPQRTPNPRPPRHSRVPKR